MQGASLELLNLSLPIGLILHKTKDYEERKEETSQSKKNMHEGNVSNSTSSFIFLVPYKPTVLSPMAFFKAFVNEENHQHLTFYDLLRKSSHSAKQAFGNSTMGQ